MSHSGSDSPLPMTHENVTCGVSDEDNPDDHQVPHEEVIDQPVRARPSISMSSDHVRPSSPQVDLYDGSGMIDLVGIRPPARFPGPYPASFTNRLPVQSKKNDLEENSTGGSKTPNKQNGSASLNPWDYVPAEIGLTKDGGPMKAKSRRRFNKRELEVLEVLWSLGKSPSKYQRQRLGAWFGV